jgi:hypothetical protein
VEQLPDAFTNIAQVTRSHIPVANAPARLQTSTTLTTEQPPKAKRGCPLGSKDTQPRQRRTTPSSSVTTTPIVATPIVTTPIVTTPTLSTHIGTDENDKIFIHYMNTGTVWKRQDISVDDYFAYHISQEVTNIPPDPKTIKEARNNLDWSELGKAINSEPDSLVKRQVFGFIVQTP